MQSNIDMKTIIIRVFAIITVGSTVLTLVRKVNKELNNLHLIDIIRLNDILSNSEKLPEVSNCNHNSSFINSMKVAGTFIHNEMEVHK